MIVAIVLVVVVVEVACLLIASLEARKAIFDKGNEMFRKSWVVESCSEFLYCS